MPTADRGQARRTVVRRVQHDAVFGLTAAGRRPPTGLQQVGGPQDQQGRSVAQLEERHRGEHWAKLARCNSPRFRLSVRWPAGQPAQGAANRRAAIVMAIAARTPGMIESSMTVGV